MTNVINKAKPLSPGHRIQQLEARIAEQQAQIERMRKAKFTLPKGKVKDWRDCESFTRVIIPDTHGAYIDKRAFSTFLSDLEILKPSHIVHLGDALDCGGFLALHHTLGFVAQADYTFEDDCHAANAMFDEVAKRCPGAKIDYLEGNHELRVDKEIIKWTIRNPRDAKYFQDMWGIETHLQLAKRGIRFIKRGQFYDKLKIAGTIDLGNCLARHGTRVGKYAAHKTVESFSTNVVFGHTHRMAMATKKTSKRACYAWSFGCLCSLQPLYADTDITDWVHGYGIQIVSKRKEFLTLQIPIIDGKSFLAPLAAELKL